MIAWQYAVRELQRRPGRALLSLFSVVIAVAAIVAVTSATATTRLAYEQVFQVLAGRADLEVTAHGGAQFDQSVVNSIRATPGIRAVLPIFHRATILYAHGKKAKALAVGMVPSEPESRAGFEVAHGRLPERGNELALETDLAGGLNVSAGETIRLLTSRGMQRYQVVGIVKLESAVRVRQGGMALAPLGQLQRDFRSIGNVNSLELFLSPPGDAAAVTAAVSKLLPAELTVAKPSTRSGLAEETLLLTEVSLNMASALSFTTAVVIVLSIFIMNVGERRPQLAILRAVGATRRQIMGIVGAEALLTGIGGTVLGIPLGIYGGSFVIRSMATLLNTNLPETPDLRWAFAVGAMLGPIICLVSAWYPARQAGQVSPLEGMRPAVDVSSKSRHWRSAIVGVIGLAIAVGIGIAASVSDVPIWTSIVAIIVSMVSLVLLTPIVLRPAVTLVGYPLRWLLGLEGEMSQRTVLRRVGRSSLTIGVLLIAVSAAIGTSNAVFSITDDVRTWYERTITADFLLRPMMPDMAGQETANMSESLGQEIRALDGIEMIDSIRFLRVDAGGQEAVLLARDFHLYDQLPLNVIHGDAATVLQNLRNGEIVVGSVLAENARIRLGDSLRITFGTRSKTFRVAGIATEYTFGGSVAFLDRDVAQAIFPLAGVDSYLIKARPEKMAELQPKLQMISDREGLLLQSFFELVTVIDSMVAGVTGGLWVLLTLGLVVGSLGVVNTLTMNVLEQTKELGMLRAIGMRRGQIVKTVIGQAAFLGAIGVVAGTIAGVTLARSMNYALSSSFGREVPFAVRPQFLAVVTAAALVIVLLSAILPGRRAAGLNPIEAMRKE